MPRRFELAEQLSQGEHHPVHKVKNPELSLEAIELLAIPNNSPFHDVGRNDARVATSQSGLRFAQGGIHKPRGLHRFHGQVKECRTTRLLDPRIGKLKLSAVRLLGVLLCKAA